MNAPTAAPHPAIPLIALAPGRAGRLCVQSGDGDAVRRLRELGFVAGTVVRVLRRSPLGDPIEVEIRGTRICIRQAELAALTVEPLDEPT
jgi:Fe2+ transport system protein FeoA